MIKIKIYRHGQTNWNVKKLTQGQTDIPLNLTGLVQAFELEKLLRDEKFDLILSSDLSRAHQTARVATKKMSADIPFILSKKLRERSFGIYEGQLSTVFEKNCHSLIEQWNSTDDDSFEATVDGIESQKDLINRFLQCLEDNINNYPMARNIAVFSHGGIMMDLVKYLAKEKRFFNNCDCLELLYDLEQAKLFLK